MQERKIHRAWLVMIGCMLNVFCTIGLSVNAFTAYQPYFLSVNGFTNTQSSLILTVRSLFTLVGMLANGLFYKRIPYRTGILAADILVASGFVLFGCLRSFAGCLFSAAVLGTGYALGGMIPVAVVIDRWFHEKKRLAFGFCLGITGCSTLGIPILITRSIETNGLPATFRMEAVFVLLLGAAAWLLIRSCPEDVGSLPYGTPVSGKGDAVRTDGVMDRKGWLVMVPTVLLSGIVATTAFSHFTVLAVGAGYSTHTAAIGMTVVGVVMIFAKIFYGWYADREGGFNANRLCGILLIAGLVMCCFVNGRNWFLYASLALYGLGLPLASVGISVWASDLSSSVQYESTVRWFNAINMAGNLLFAPVPGILADRFGGSYRLSYVIFSIFAVVLLAGVQSVYRRKIGKETIS